MGINERVASYRRQYMRRCKEDMQGTEKTMPGNVYFIEDDEILAIPRDDGDCRYPLGKDGFNYWVYASGYMHCNEGLFSPFLRATEGQEPKIAFFVGIGDKAPYEVVPLLAVPMVQELSGVQRYTVFTKAAIYYMTEVGGLTFALRIFVDGMKKIYYTLHVTNHSSEMKKCFVSSYFNPFLKHGVMEGAENRWFRQSSVLDKRKEEQLNPFLVEVFEERDRGAMAPNYGVFTRCVVASSGGCIEAVEETTSRNNYVGGIRSSLHTPKALIKGTFGADKKSITTFTEIAIAADMIHVSLEPTSTIRQDTVMTYCFEKEDMELALEEEVCAKKIDDREDKMDDEVVLEQKGIMGVFGKGMETPLKEEILNGFFEHLKKQVSFCATIKGFIQLSNFSLIGIRDVFQAIEALVFWQPDIAKAKMLEALGFIAPSGRCPRQYSLPKFEGDAPAMDLREFIDQGVWVISTVSTYLKWTQDFEFLEMKCGYYDFIDDKNHVVKKINQESTVLQHLMEILSYLLKNRDHDYTKCVCALYGDWNDALDGLGVSRKKDKVFGTGVSVMATLQVYQNCHEMIELLSQLDKEKYKHEIEVYTEGIKEIEEGLYQYAIVKDERGNKRIVHGWGDERSYLVGSYEDPDGSARDGITSNAFWVLSGLYDKDISIKETILQAYERLSSKYGLKTFEPHFEIGTPGVGRIPNLPKGTAENGAAYIHASAFGIMSLFRMGEASRAWQELTKILPFTHEKISVSPYVMPNAYGYNEEKGIDGESMQDWQTGASNVVLKTFIRFVFGIEPQYEGIWIQPAVAMPFERTTFKIQVRNTELTLIYSNKQIGKRIFMLNGKRVESVYDSVMKLDKLWIDNYQIKNNGNILVEIID